jgi:hypothetical protein
VTPAVGGPEPQTLAEKYYSGQCLIALEWISVADALPDDEAVVLIALNDGDVLTGYRDGGIWRCVDAMPIAPEGVTHWMHLPPPPGGDA